MEKYGFKRFLSLALAIVMVLSNVPVQAFATDGTVTPCADDAHDYSINVVNDATCTADGSKYQICSVCQTQTEPEVIPAKGHDFGENAATCACGEPNPNYVAPVSEEPEHVHAWGEPVVVEATCDAAGSSTRTCSAEGCDVVTETTTIDALGHDYVEGVCSRCQAEEAQPEVQPESSKGPLMTSTGPKTEETETLDQGDDTQNSDAGIEEIAEESDGLIDTVEDLADAIAAAQDGATIVLGDQLTIEGETFTIAEGKSITLDMNGKKLTVTDNKDNKTCYELFYIYGELTVIGEGTIELISTSNDTDWLKSSTIFHNRGGKLTIENGTFNHTGGTAMAFVVDNNANSYGDATTNIKGGTLTSTYVAIRNRMDTYGANGTPGNGIPMLIIEGGELSGKRAVWGQVSSAGAKGEIYISGGKLTADVGEDVVRMGTDSNPIEGGIVTEITGGIFSSDVSAYVPAGYEQNEAGEVVVKTTTEEPDVEEPEVEIEKPETVTEELAKQVVTEIQEKIDVTTATSVPADMSLVIELAKAAVDANVVPTKLVYNVAPMKGDEKQTNAGQEITFRLPIPESWTKTHAKVTHDNVEMGIFAIQTENGDRYVSVTSQYFSKFAVEPADAPAEAAAKIGDQGFDTLADALNAAKGKSGEVTVEIYDKVTLSQPLTGSYDSIKFVGKDTDAEIYLDVQGYTTATGKKVAFEGLTLSKSEGSFLGNAGFMNVAFGIYDVTEVTYTNCVFTNGACASSGTVTFNECTFKKSWDKYSLWAYGDVNCTVNGGTFDNDRGIKMYAEGKAKTTDLTVKGADFSALTGKPAIVLTSGKSVTLEGNTYSTTGVFELDLDGVPNGTPVTSTDAITAKNDNGACGVLVDGKIYTTVAQAAEVAKSGSTVTLLHDSTETVELAEGVTLDKNGYTADSVIVVKPVAKIGDQTYTSLQAAVNAVKDGETIVLLADVADVDVTISKNVTIDLGDKTITDAYIKTAAAVTIKNGSIKNVNESYPLVVNSGELTVEDVAIEASKSDRAIWVCGGALVFNSGSILATKGENNTSSGNITAIYTSSNTSVTINGGNITVDAPGNKAVAIFGNYANADVTVNGGKISTSGGNYSYGIHVDGDITINDGEIVTNEKQYGYSSGITYGYNYALNSALGNITINGGKITTNGHSGYIANVGRTYSSQDQTITINGGEFVNNLTEIDKTTGKHQAPVLIKEGSASNVTATISNGTVKGFSADLLKGSKTTLTISGGSFDVEINDQYLAEGFKLEQRADGNWGVAEIPPVAKIGEQGYKTLKAAVEAAVQMSEESVTIVIAEGTYAEDLNLTNADVTVGNEAKRPNITFQPAEGAQVTLAGTVTLGYRNQGVGASTWNGEVTFKGITFDHAESGKNSLDIQDVKGITLDTCTVSGDGETGITSPRGNATTKALFTGCTFNNGAMQVLGLLGANLKVTGSTMNNFRFNVQAGGTPGMTIENSTFNLTLTDANVGDSFYAVRTNACHVNLSGVTVNVDSTVNGVAADQEKWAILYARKESNAKWTVSDVEVNLTAAAAAQTELLLVKNEAGAANADRITITGLTSENNNVADLIARSEGYMTANGSDYKDGSRIIKGSITPGYVSETGVWGEGGGNATESVVIKLYVNDAEIGSASLNNVGGIIDGDVYVTWSIPFAGSTDEYWTVNWAEGHPNKNDKPTKVKMWIDGTLVAENDVQMNGPDNMNPVVWQDLDYFKNAAKIGDVEYKTLALAAAAAKAADEIVLLDDVTIATDVTIPNGVTLNGNGFSIHAANATDNNGYVIAGGELTIKGKTNVEKFSASYYNHVVNIGVGASLNVFGTKRVTLGYGNTFNITGTITNAKTADKATIQPSLIIPAGISIAGGISTSNKPATMNVTNAYIQLGPTTGNKNGSGTFVVSFDNSIADISNNFSFDYRATGVFDLDAKNSVLNLAKNFDLTTAKCEALFDNTVVTVGSSLRNEGTLKLINGSEMIVKYQIQPDEHGGHFGTITVDDSDLIIECSSLGHAVDGNNTGKLEVVNGGIADIDYIIETAINVDAKSSLTAKEIKDSTINVDASDLDFGSSATVVETGMTEAELSAITTIENANGAVASYANGDITLTKGQAVAKIGETKYTSVADALAAAKDAGMTDVTITLIGNVTKDEAVSLDDSFNLYTQTQFNSVTFKQEDNSQPYYIAGIYTGSRTDGGKFIFDGVNLTVTDQYIFEGNVELINNSKITSTAAANCFVYDADVTVNAGSSIKGVIEDIRGGTLTIDGGKTDGNYTETPGLQDSILVVNWTDSKLVLKNGAYVKVNALNEVGRLTVNGTMDVADSKLESYEWIAVNKDATLKVSGKSIITTQKITGAGDIEIDATGKTIDEVPVINGDASAFTGNITVTGNEDLYAVIENGKIVVKERVYVAQIQGGKKYESLSDALTAATNGATINLIWSEGDAPIAMNGSVYGKTVTITGTATVDWSKNWLFVGRGGEGDGKVIFNNANLTSASNNASTGIHVSGREKNTSNKYDGTLEIKNSTIELDYLINRGAIVVDNSTFTVKNGFGIAGRPASETENGEAATATIDIENNSKVKVLNHNGMGVGLASTIPEGYGIMNVDATSTFQTTQNFRVSANGTMNLAGTANMAGTLTNEGSIVLTDAKAILKSSECGKVTTNVADHKVVYADGAYKPVEKVYVAQLGTQKFETLKDAIAAATAGDTITLLAADNNEKVTISKNLTIDGAGKTFSGEMTVNGVGVTLTVKNATLKAEGSYVIFTKQSNITIENCKLTSDATAANYYGYKAIVIAEQADNSNVKISGCTASNLYYPVYFTQGGKSLVIENSTITDCVYLSSAMKCKDVTVEDVTYTGMGGLNIRYTNGKLLLKNVTITTTMADQYPVAMFDNNDTGTYVINLDGTKNTANGKEMRGDNVSEWLILQDATNPYKVNDMVNSVAKIGDDYYMTLEEAIAVAKNNDAIDLLKDIEISSTLTIGSNSAFDKINVTINGNGKTIKAVGTNWNDNTWMTDIPWNVTLNDVIFDGNNTGCKGVQFYTSKSTLDNVTVKNMSADKWGITDYAVHANASELTISGLTFMNCKHGRLMVDMGSSLPAEYTSSNVTVAENANMTGVTVVLSHAAASLTAPKDASYVTMGNVPGFMMVYENGVHKLSEVVAKIGEQSYATLADAINAANGNTVTVMTDIVLTETVTVPAGKTVTLDLNGKTVSMEDSSAKACYMIENKGSLTIMDSSEEQNGKLTFKSTTPSANNNYSTSTIGNSGTLVVESGIIENTTESGASYAIDTVWYTDPVSVSINGGKIISKRTAVRQVLYSATAQNTLNISGGEIEGNAAVQTHNFSNEVCLADVNISGGTLSGTYAYYTSYSYNNTHAGTDVEITGGTFDGAVYIYNGKNGSSETNFANVAVKGGEFLDEFYVYTKNATGELAAIPAISGGTYSGADAYEYLAEGYAADIGYVNGKVVYGVKVDENVYAAQIGNGTKYRTIAEAIAHASANATIYLLKDVAEEVVINKAVVLDLNDKTLTGTIKLENLGATVKGPEDVTVTTSIAGKNVGYADGIHKVVDKVYVAQVGETKYETLSEAISKATAGATINLLADITENVTISNSVKINGKKSGAGNYKYTGTMTANAGLTVTVEYVDFVNGGIAKSTKNTTGTYTIKNCNFDGEGKYAYPCIFKGADKVTIEDCTVKNYMYSFLYVTSSTNSVSVKNVTVEDCPNYAVYFASGVTNATIEGLTVKNSTNGFIINNTADRAFTIKNVKLENVTNAISNANGTNTITCTVLGDKNDFGTAASNEYTKYILAEETATLTAGENFNVTTNVTNCHAEYENGVYFVKGNVAAIGETTYATLADAIKVAIAGDTINLLADITENVTISKSVNINGKKYKYTGTMTANAGLTVTVENVDFVNGGIAKSSKSTSGTYTIKNCNFDGAGTYAYAFRFNGANKVTIENCTVKNYLYSFLYIQSSTNSVSVKGVTVEDCPNYAVYFASGVNNAMIENLTVKNSGNGFVINNTADRAFTIKNVKLDNVTNAISNANGTNTITCKVLGNENDFGTAASNEYTKYILAEETATLTAAENFNVTSGVEGLDVHYREGKHYLDRSIAQVGNVVYGSLQAAIDAAQNNETVVLLQNINLSDITPGTLDSSYDSYFIVSGKTITVDLNGKTISGAYEYKSANSNIGLVGVFSTDVGGHLTLTGDGTIDVTADENNKVYYLLSNYDDDTASMTIENGTYKLNAAQDALIHTANCNVVVNGGTFTLSNVGITGNNGRPWIFNGNGQNDNFVTVNGGTFNADVNHQFWANEVYVPETKALRDNGDNTWTVVDAVAYVMEKAGSTGSTERKVGYATLAEAVEAAEEGKTVTLLKDLSESIKLEKSIMVDVNGTNYTGTIELANVDATVKGPAGMNNVTTDLDGCKVGYADGIYKLETEVAKNVVTGETYNDVQVALNKASAGQTVQLLKNAEAGMLMITGGITLDLNGYELAASYLAAFNTNHVVDNSTKKTGKLIVAKNNIVLASNNSQMPIWNGDHYVFGNTKVNSQKKNTSTNDFIEIEFRPSCGSVFNGLFKDGMEDNRLKVVVQLYWEKEGSDGVQTQSFVYNEDIVQLVYQNNKTFRFTASGLSQYNNMKAKCKIVSDLGVEFSTEDIKVE